MDKQIHIKEAASDHEIDLMRMLFCEYAESLNFDLCFQGFKEELAGLPGRYAPPEGIMLLAFVDNEPAACIAMRPLGNRICEMKRLFVRTDYRGIGIGRMLSQRLLEAAQEQNYEKMRLDTLATMTSARSLYRSLGFYEIDAYCHNPLDDAVYMERDLIKDTVRAT